MPTTSTSSSKPDSAPPSYSEATAPHPPHPPPPPPPQPPQQPARIAAPRYESQQPSELARCVAQLPTTLNAPRQSQTNADRRRNRKDEESYCEAFCDSPLPFWTIVFLGSVGLIVGGAVMIALNLDNRNLRYTGIFLVSLGGIPFLYMMAFVLAIARAMCTS